MRKCPVCSVNLEFTKYENEGVQYCPSCHGYLVDINALGRIKRNEIYSKEELDERLKNDFQLNTTQAIRCPRCHLEMKKNREHFEEIQLDIMLDYCKSCQLLWLDGGELEALQQGYEASSVAIEHHEMLERVKEFEDDEERQQTFEENVAKARNPMNPVIEGVQEGVKEGLKDVLIGRVRRRRFNVFDIISSLFME